MFTKLKLTKDFSNKDFSTSKTAIWMNARISNKCEAFKAV